VLILYFDLSGNQANIYDANNGELNGSLELSHTIKVIKYLCNLTLEMINNIRRET